MTIRGTAIDRLLAERQMSIGDFADAIGITPANVAVLKNGRAKAVQFSTLDAICRVLDCQPGLLYTRSERPVPPTTYRIVRHALASALSCGLSSAGQKTPGIAGPGWPGHADAGTCCYPGLGAVGGLGGLAAARVEPPRST